MVSFYNFLMQRPQLRPIAPAPVSKMVDKKRAAPEEASSSMSISSLLSSKREAESEKYLRRACPQCGARTTPVKRKACDCGHVYASSHVTTSKAAEILKKAALKLEGSDVEYVTFAVVRTEDSVALVHSMASPALQPLANYAFTLLRAQSPK